MIKTYNIFYVIIRIIILFPCGLNGSKYFPRKARVGAQRRSLFPRRRRKYANIKTVFVNIKIQKIHRWREKSRSINFVFHTKIDKKMIRGN